jgi:hypothetical protein
MALNMKVDEPVRTITLELDSTTADEMSAWLRDAGKANNNVRPHHGIDQLYGALRAIADNRGYGGH